MHYPFFSIIVPAHNEEGYIGATLECLKALDYPADRYEVIVVENGSTDRTREEASASGIGRVISTGGRGVAQARRDGALQANERADWLLFLDADTLLGPSFLADTARFLATRREENDSAGVVAIRPEKSSLIGEMFFLWTNFSRSFTRTPYTVFFVKRSVYAALPPPDASREIGEDVELVKHAAHFGTVFFFPTNAARTSTRRFQKGGWFATVVYWLFIMPLPASIQRRLRYTVVR